nr:hypothetical protein [Tanacetum cinerariifolium]
MSIFWRRGTSQKQQEQEPPELKSESKNTKSMENQIKHLMYLMENAMLNLSEGQEEMAWLINFTGWSFSTNVPV